MSIENEVPLTDFEDEDEPEKTPGQGYDDGEYWDNRYGTWAQDPYDWLVEYQGAFVRLNRHMKCACHRHRTIPAAFL